MKLDFKTAVNRLTSFLTGHLLPMALIVSVSVHLAALGLVMNHRKPLIVIQNTQTPILVTLMQAHSSVLMEESKLIIQSKVIPRPSRQIEAQKVIKEKAKPAFAPPEKLPKVQQLVAIDIKKASLSEIPKPQIKDVIATMPIEAKEEVSHQKISLTPPIDAPKGIVNNPLIAVSTDQKTAPVVKTGISISASYAKTNQKPDYPTQSRRLNEEGTVVLTVLVLADGKAGMVEVKSSSGYPMLDQSAKDAVKQWHFNPATIDGKPIDESYSLSIPFKLNG